MRLMKDCYFEVQYISHSHRDRIFGFIKMCAILNNNSRSLTQANENTVSQSSGTLLSILAHSGAGKKKIFQLVVSALFYHFNIAVWLKVWNRYPHITTPFS